MLKKRHEKQLIVGIIGHPGSGKDSVAEYLSTKGFDHFSTSDTLREMMTEHGLPLDRPSMHTYSQNLYTAGEARALTARVINRIAGHAIVSGFRNRIQIQHFKEMFGDSFLLLCVDAPAELRYSRIISRQREGDRVTFEEFQIQEDRERNNESGSHEVDRLIEIADVVIKNTGPKEELLAHIDVLL